VVEVTKGLESTVCRRRESQTRVEGRLEQEVLLNSRGNYREMRDELAGK